MIRDINRERFEWKRREYAKHYGYSRYPDKDIPVIKGPSPQKMREQDSERSSK